MSALVAVKVTVVVIVVAGAVYKPVGEIVPDADPIGLTPLIDQVGVPVPLATVAVNCCVPPLVNVTAEGFTVTLSAVLLVAKKTPLITAFALLVVDVTVIFTFPDTVHTRYTPFVNPDIVSLSRVALVTASVITTCSCRPEESQSSAYSAIWCEPDRFTAMLNDDVAYHVAAVLPPPVGFSSALGSVVLEVQVNAV